MEYKFTDENFKEEVLQSEVPVMVDFYADWCNPCKMMAPLVKDLAEKFNGNVLHFSQPGTGRKSKYNYAVWGDVNSHISLFPKRGKGKSNNRCGIQRRVGISFAEVVNEKGFVENS